MKPFILFFLLCSFAVHGDDAVLLAYRHREETVLHAESLVDETVYIDGYLSHQAEIDEFSVSRILGLSEDGSASLESDFRTVERIGGHPGFFQWMTSEKVRLERDSRGRLTVPTEATRPVLRHVPSFPDYPVRPGDSWSFPAEEVHVLRIGGITFGPYRSSAQVLYRYLDNRNVSGRKMARILLEYNIYLPVREPGEPVQLISGQSAQEILWDIDEGQPFRKEEEFEFMIMIDGHIQEFRGRGNTEYRLTERLDRNETVEALRHQLDDMPGMTVREAEEGVLLSLFETDDIYFEPESSMISENQKQRLESLAESLFPYAHRDILITGHTAGYGTAEGRKRLSLERAAAAGDVLFPAGRSGSGKLFLRGAGNSEPTGSDTTDRRVEILILD